MTMDLDNTERTKPKQSKTEKEGEDQRWKQEAAEFSTSDVLKSLTNASNYVRCSILSESCD